MSMISPIIDGALSTAAALSAAASARAQRQDGWTPDAQRAFLEAIAEGHCVEAACRRVGLSHQSAYALRRRAAGASFALGWQAASLIARNRLADALVARALDGQVETYTRPDGSTFSRHRYDNRLATAMLTRLDRLADDAAAEGTHHAARLVAQEFDAFLDIIERDDGPARAGLFLGMRLGGASGGGAAPADLAPVVALARADRWCRTGAALAGDVSLADLDPTQRAHWTADQWARAEEAGLLVIAAPAADPASPGGGATGGDPQLMQPDAPAEYVDEPVWWDEERVDWRTHFPPPPDFRGVEDGEYGDDFYARALTREEYALVEAADGARRAALLASDMAARDAYFGFAPRSAANGQADVPADAGSAPDDVGNDADDAAADDADGDRADRAGDVAATGDDMPDGAPAGMGAGGGAGGGDDAPETWPARDAADVLERLIDRFATVGPPAPRQAPPEG